MQPLTAMSQQAGAEAMTEHAHAKTPVSTTLSVTVDGKTATLSMADLQAMPQKSVTVQNAHTKTKEIYTGVSLGDLLAKYGFVVSPATHKKMLRSYLMAEGIDKYWVLFSAAEVESSEHNGDVIVALAVGGKSLGEDGQFKLVASEDKKPQRWVRNLTAITIKSAE